MAERLTAEREAEIERTVVVVRDGEPFDTTCANMLRHFYATNVTELLAEVRALRAERDERAAARSLLLAEVRAIRAERDGAGGS